MWRQRTDEAGGPSLERAECRGRRAARAASAWGGVVPRVAVPAPRMAASLSLWLGQRAAWSLEDGAAEATRRAPGWKPVQTAPRESVSSEPRVARGTAAAGGAGWGRGASAEDVHHRARRAPASGADLCPRPAPPAPPPGVWTCAERSAGRRRGNGPVSPVPATTRRRVRARSSESPVTQFPSSFCASFFPLEGTRRLPGPVRRTSQLSSRLSANDPRRGGAVIVLRPLLHPSPRPRSCCGRGSRTARALLQGPRPRLRAHGPSPGLASVLRRFSVPI